MTPLFPQYSGSHALVIGINEYKTASPLRYAVNDAIEFAEVLRVQFQFPAENVHLLLDSAATRSAIMERFLSFACGVLGSDDRLVVFFAGHGHTEVSSRGEVGLLVPWEGDARHLSSLIRWDELTRNADLIYAKHILFIMDACYGGLAITRFMKPGSMRFLKDMLLRSARQVLTAGKADEVVADLGGPRPNHSIFTGHLLEALTGAAADEHGVITANGVISYTYRAVSGDPESHQTPHFGYLSGEGDLIFAAPLLATPATSEQKDEDTLFAVPPTPSPSTEGPEVVPADITKELLSDERLKIKLHDHVMQQVREILLATGDDYFPAKGEWSVDEFAGRLHKYESLSNELLATEALLGFWGESWHRKMLTLGPQHLSARAWQSRSGSTAWLSLRWYPALLLLYSGGIAAISAGRYDNLLDLLLMTVVDPEKPLPLVLAVTTPMNKVVDVFKSLPGRERQYTPRSEYLHKLLQPLLDDLLFLGPEYETSFDRFEILYALEHAYQYSAEGGRVWGPIGRFGWKYQSGDYGSPYHLLMAEAKKRGTDWEPVKAGFFGGSMDRFFEIASQYGQLLAGLHWH